MCCLFSSFFLNLIFGYFSLTLCWCLRLLSDITGEGSMFIVSASSSAVLLFGFRRMYVCYSFSRLLLFVLFPTKCCFVLSFHLNQLLSSALARLCSVIETFLDIFIFIFLMAWNQSRDYRYTSCHASRRCLVIDRCVNCLTYAYI